MIGPLMTRHFVRTDLGLARVVRSSPSPYHSVGPVPIDSCNATDGPLPLNPFGIAYWRMRSIVTGRAAPTHVRPRAGRMDTRSIPTEVVAGLTSRRERPVSGIGAQRTGRQDEPGKWHVRLTDTSRCRGGAPPTVIPSLPRNLSARPAGGGDRPRGGFVARWRSSGDPSTSLGKMGRRSDDPFGIGRHDSPDHSAPEAWDDTMAAIDQ